MAGELTREELESELLLQREHYQNVIARMEAELRVLREWFKEREDKNG